VSTVGAILGLLSTLLILVVWIIINNAIPVAIGSWFHVAALLLAGITGLMVYVQVER